MYKVRIEDRELGKTMYLFPKEADAKQQAVLLGRGHLERFEVRQHSSELGWFIKDKESGRIFDAQGLVQ